MTSVRTIDFYKGQHREIVVATPGDELLGPFKNLPGIWEGKGTGWNMIALPFKAEPGSRLNYRLLLNQFDETLNFALVDKGVPNRGLDEDEKVNTDQVVATLDYEQSISQIAVTDRPESTVTGLPGSAIHHEPGLFLNMLNETDGGPNIARLATIPHGDAALALGTSFEFNGSPRIGQINGLPIGVPQELDLPYLEPYRFFHENPFFGTVPQGAPGFPGFDPVEPHKLLELANQASPVARTTVIELDTAGEPGGIRNIPFVVKQANAVSMKSTFWVNELEAKDAQGNPKLQLQYAQIVMLEFFDRFDGLPGRIAWPHVSINTLEKKSDTPAPYDKMTR